MAVTPLGGSIVGSIERIRLAEIVVLDYHPARVVRGVARRLFDSAIYYGSPYV
jgi:hypothetical protein